MEDLSKKAKDYEKLLTSKNNICYLEKDKYILNLNKEYANGDKLYKCKFYLNKNIKCPAQS